MSNNSEKKAVQEKDKPRNREPLNPSIYVFDPETGEWKFYNPSGSVAYNVLSRDEWSWLD